MVFVLLPVSFAAEVTPFVGKLKPNQSAAHEIYIKVENQEIKIDLVTIEALPLYQTTMNLPWLEEGNFVGVKLKDVLFANGIEEFELLWIKAINDFQVTLPSTTIGIDDALLVTRFNNKILDNSEFGPYFLVWPEEAETIKKASPESFKWIWNINRIIKVK